MAIKTRQTTATGVTNAGAPLTNDEVDNNFVELKQAVSALETAANVLSEFEFTATAGQTVFTGSDNNGATLAVASGNSIVTLNGVILDNGSDYTATSNAGVTLTTAAAASDHLAVITFSTFSVADTVAASTGGTFGGALTVSGGVNVSGSSSFEEIKEKVLVDSTTTGVITHALATGPAIVFYNVDQTTARMVSLTGANTFLDTGQSTTTVFMLKQGTTAYYPTAFSIDGSITFPEWQGGSAPTSGNASGIDVYSYTVIKTANNTFTVLASQTQFA